VSYKSFILCDVEFDLCLCESVVVLHPLRCEFAACPMASDPASWPGWIPVLPRIPRFPMGRGPQIYKESLGWPSYAARYACFQGATACFRGAWHLSHHGLQDMRACDTLMLARCADMRLQCYVGPADHTQDTTTVQGDPSGWCHTANRVQCGRVTRQDTLMPLKALLATSSH
jgi:hypothetical protein